ncbi:MAG: zinc-dependent metalloprotease family protein [Gallionellaceae bacterium]|jgi:hypothetical protein
MPLSRFISTFFAFALCAATNAGAETIDIRFIVSDDFGVTKAQRKTTQERLKTYVDVLNGYYRNSEVALRAEIVQVEFSRIAAVNDVQIIDDMAHERNGFEAMLQKAHDSGADYTIAIVSKLIVQGRPGCGRAYAVNQSVAAISDPRKAFAVVHFACGAHTIAHELGHLMGLNHGALIAQCRHDKTNLSAIAPYANGYAEGNCDGKPQPTEFGDIMVGGGMREIMGNDKGNLPIFSNPRIHDKRCGENRTCGDPAIGDAARALNENARYYASHKEQPARTPHY